MVDLQKLETEINAGCMRTMTKEQIIDDLAATLCHIGRLWDKVTDTDPLKGLATKYGTPNHRSMTYKLRKIARYSYP